MGVFTRQSGNFPRKKATPAAVGDHAGSAFRKLKPLSLLGVPAECLLAAPAPPFSDAVSCRLTGQLTCRLIALDCEAHPLIAELTPLLRQDELSSRLQRLSEVSECRPGLGLLSPGRVQAEFAQMAFEDSPRLLGLMRCDLD